MPETLGKGFHTDIDDLHLHVEVHVDGWSYRIIRAKGNQIVKDWSSPAHPSINTYSEPENVKFQAVSDALLELERIHDDPHKVFEETEWEPYGGGH